MKSEILSLRKLGMSIGEISRRTGYTITQVCEVVYQQNQEDIEKDN